MSASGSLPKTIGPACSSDATCSTCSFPPASRLRRVVWQQPVDEAVRLLGVRVDLAGGAARVLDDVDVAELVVLDALESALAHDAPEVRDLRRVVERRLDDAAAGAALGGEEQALGERIPGRAVDHRHGGLAVGLGLGELRHAMRGIGIEVDARDVRAGGRAELVALVEEVRAVVVLRVSAVLALDDEVRVLVRLALRRLDVVARAPERLPAREPSDRRCSSRTSSSAPRGSRARSSPARPWSRATAARACRAARCPRSSCWRSRRR